MIFMLKFFKYSVSTSIITKGFLITGLLLFLLLQTMFIQGSAMASMVIDNAGRHVEFSKPFQRIITLYGAHTENLFYLGADKQIIGVSINDTFPEKVKTKTSFSYHDDAEKFIGANPDLIIIRPMIDKGYYKLFSSLERFGIVVISLQPSNTEEMYDYWLKLGSLTGRDKEAYQMVQEFKKQVSIFNSLNKTIAKRKTVYFEAIHQRMKTFTQNSMPGFVLKTAGGINVAIDAKASRNTNIANYGKEKILSHALKIDVFLAQKGVMNNITKTIIKNEPGFQVIKAIANDQIYLIDEEIISRPGFRLLKGIKTIGKILYPDIYNNLSFD
ncbi:MAG: ABC transporter substrate-binding protein [Desulfobacteraceae bacterium]|nr:ABC transporter substrate-binding protein [Desulfobacteraceae bacterium]